MLMTASDLQPHHELTAGRTGGLVIGWYVAFGNSSKVPPESYVDLDKSEELYRVSPG